MGTWSFGDLAALRKLLAGGGVGAPETNNGAASKPSRVEGHSWLHGMGPGSVCGLGIAAGIALGPLLLRKEKKCYAAFEGSTGNPWPQLAALPFASVTSTTLAPPAMESANLETEPVTGLQFPKLISSKKPCCKGPDKPLELSGLGVRTKKLFGIANIRVYAYGVYVDPAELKRQLGAKYESVPVESLRTSKWLLEDLMASDTPVVIRLVISYKNLKIGQVKKAFTESLGGSLEALSGTPQTELLESFTKWFTDDVTLQRGTVIDLKRSRNYWVTTEFDGKPAGTIKSGLLSRALLSLYLGQGSFDAHARAAVQDSCTAILAATNL